MLPKLTNDNVVALVPGVENVALVGRGGQKLVFRGDLDGTTYALKFALVPNEGDPEDAVSAAEARASREIETMRECDSSHMVKVGPVGLTIREVAGQHVLFFTEEFIRGEDLDQRLTNHGPFAPDDVRRVGLDIADAIRALWEMDKVHRDIKPKNIMRRESDGSFVLLDAGYAFDLVGESLSQGMLVGTIPYFPPERFDYTSRRSLIDFRSDLFSLGVTMYQLATGVHPFMSPDNSSQQVFARILRERPCAPSTINSNVPASLDRVILRMLGKAPHLRYRKIEHLVVALGVT